MKSPFVMFDRDGTLIDHVHHLSSREMVKLKPNIGESLSRLAISGFRFGMITNQSVIGRKLASLVEVQEINQVISDHLKIFGVEFDFILICPHLPEENCQCRKPRIELGIKASNEFSVDLAKSYYVGDQPTDVEFARNLGCKSVLVVDQESILNGSDFIAQNLLDASEWIIIDSAERNL